MELIVKDLSVDLGNTPILHNISFSMKAGEFIGIIGPNGSGKTTLLKSIRGLIPRKRGNIVFNGTDIESMGEEEVAKYIAYMQQQVHLSFGYKAKEIVMTARYPYLKWWQQEGREDHQIVQRVMEEIGVWHLREQPIQLLSGGERQRVFLAKALAQDTEVLFLDEPTAAVDLVYGDDIFRRCRDICKEGKTIAVVVHDLELASKYCSRLLMMSHGRLYKDGSVEDVLQATHLKEAFGLDSAVYDDPYFKQRRIFVFPKNATSTTMYQRIETLPDSITMPQEIGHDK